MSFLLVAGVQVALSTHPPQRNRTSRLSSPLPKQKVVGDVPGERKRTNSERRCEWTPRGLVLPLEVRQSRTSAWNPDMCVVKKLPFLHGLGRNRLPHPVLKHSTVQSLPPFMRKSRAWCSPRSVAAGGAQCQRVRWKKPRGGDDGPCLFGGGRGTFRSKGGRLRSG